MGLFFYSVYFYVWGKHTNLIFDIFLFNKTLFMQHYHIIMHHTIYKWQDFLSL